MVLWRYIYDDFLWNFYWPAKTSHSTANSPPPQGCSFFLIEKHWPASQWGGAIYEKSRVPGFFFFFGRKSRVPGFHLRPNWVEYSIPICKFPNKDFTCILMRGINHICEKKSWYPGFSSKKKKNPGYQDLQGKFFGRYAPDQNTDLYPNEGGADGILLGGEFAVVDGGTPCLALFIREGGRLPQKQARHRRNIFGVFLDFFWLMTFT